MNKLTSSTSALKGIGVSSNALNFKEKGRILELTEQQETHYLDFNQYRQDLRIGYSAGYAEKNFNKVQRIIGLPDDTSRVVFISVKLKGKNADWITANNACNAFEMKIKRILWKRKWKYVNTFIGSIEFDKEYLTYHFHILLILKELKLNLNDDEIKDTIIKILKSLEETNEKNAGMVKYRMFPFSLKTRELGETIHYLIKTSSKNYNPLARTILNTKEQLQLKQL
tara:strand:- start:43 stop:720 length:678 start_codon:yes stop_codon:yes gene_type:complete